MKKIKTINDRETVKKLVELIQSGKARVIKEFIDGDPAYTIWSSDMHLIGRPSQRYLFVFKALVEKHGKDGLFEGTGQSV